MEKHKKIIVIGYLGAGAALAAALSKLTPKPTDPKAGNFVQPLAKGEVAHLTRS